MLDQPDKRGTTGKTKGPALDFQQHLAALEAPDDVRGEIVRGRAEATGGHDERRTDDTLYMVDYPLESVRPSAQSTRGTNATHGATATLIAPNGG